MLITEDHPHVTSVGIASENHTGFRFANILRDCTNATSHQINYPNTSCNRVSNIKCFSRDSTLKI